MHAANASKNAANLKTGYAHETAMHLHRAAEGAHRTAAKFYGMHDDPEAQQSHLAAADAHHKAAQAHLRASKSTGESPVPKNFMQKRFGANMEQELVDNTWSDEARSASSAARAAAAHVGMIAGHRDKDAQKAVKASYKASSLSDRAKSPEDHMAASGAHRDAANLHADAANGTYTSGAHMTAGFAHDKASMAHEKAAKELTPKTPPFSAGSGGFNPSKAPALPPAQPQTPPFGGSSGGGGKSRFSGPGPHTPPFANEETANQTSQTTDNSLGGNMAATKQELVRYLTTNCDCWKDAESPAVLNSMSEEKLTKLVKAYNLNKKNEAIANSATKGIQAGLKWDHEASRFVVVNDMPDSNFSEAVTDGSVDSAMGKKKTKEDGDDKNCDGGSMEKKTMSDNEYLATLPPHFRSAVVNAVKHENAERQKLIAKLTANVKDKAVKTRLAKQFSDPRQYDLEALHNMASMIPEPTPDFLGNQGFQRSDGGSGEDLSSLLPPSYLGNAIEGSSEMAGNEQGDDMLPQHIPMDFSQPIFKNGQQ